MGPFHSPEKLPRGGSVEGVWGGLKFEVKKQTDRRDKSATLEGTAATGRADLFVAGSTAFREFSRTLRRALIDKNPTTTTGSASSCLPAHKSRTENVPTTTRVSERERAKLSISSIP